MNILICVWRLTHGGAERVASLWAQGFANQGHSVSFLLGSYSSPITYEIPQNSKIYYECKTNDKINVHVVPTFWKNRNIRKIISKVRPDVIICVLPNWGERIRSALGESNTIPIIITEHNSYDRPDNYPMSQIQYIQKFETNRKFDAVTVLTKADYVYLEGKKGKEFTKNTFVLPNPVSFTPIEFVPKKEKIILAAGRLNAWECKGFDVLIKAWSKIESEFSDWKLYIAGEGNKSYLTDLQAKLKLNNRLSFLGFVDMLEWYKKASIFVLSSRYEGFGMVLTEAMSQGCACIACDYKGRQREIIQNDSQGITCPVEDIDELAKAIKKMIIDESYRQQCQKNAIDRSKYYTIPNIMKLWNNIFSTLNKK